MDFLEKSKLFSGLLPAELAVLQQAVQVQSFNPGDVIFQEGDKGTGIYLIYSGLVQISALVSPHERRILTELGPGEFFGEMAVLDNEPRSATASAAQETITHFIPRADLLRMLENSPKLAVSLVREFSLRMRDFNRKYIEEVLQAERLTLVGRFARSVVHDFKNPLNVISIAAQMAADEAAGPEARQLARTRICKQVDRLSNMINELLEFTRGSQNATVLAQTNYAQYVQALVEEARLELQGHNITIEFENPPPDLVLLMNPNRLTHVFYNLFHNAVDAMPEGGRIRLNFCVADGFVVTEIKDAGPGIAPEIEPRMFEAFATYGKAQGTGLGLSICKRIIDDHCGHIDARNNPEGGAIFRFTLPINQPQTPQQT